MTVPDLIRKYAGKFYLEIGVNEGESLTAALESPNTQLVVGVDTWGSEYGGTNRGTSQWILEKIGPLANKCMLITGDSKAILPKLDFEADLIFIDGDHSAEGCMKDLENCLRLLHPSGVILVDDIDHPAHPYIRAVCVEFAASRGLDIGWYPPHYGVAKLTRP